MKFKSYTIEEIYFLIIWLIIYPILILIVRYIWYTEKNTSLHEFWCDNIWVWVPFFRTLGLFVALLYWIDNTKLSKFIKKKTSKIRIK